MTKTDFMLISLRQKLSQLMESPSLAINENAVEQITSAKSLRVYVDQNINWECHIEHISKKIAYAIVQLNEFGISLHSRIFKLKFIIALFNHILITVEFR